MTCRSEEDLEDTNRSKRNKCAHNPNIPSNKTKKKPLSQKERKKKEIIDKKLLTEPSKGCKNKMIRIAKAIMENPAEYSQISSDQIARIDIKSKWPLSHLGPGFAVRG